MREKGDVDDRCGGAFKLAVQTVSVSVKKGRQIVTNEGLVLPEILSIKIKGVPHRRSGNCNERRSTKKWGSCFICRHDGGIR